MPVQNVIDPSNRLVITTCSGEMTLEEIVGSAEALRADPQFSPGFRHLNDLSLVTRFDVRYADLNLVRNSLDPFSNQCQRAFVAPGTGMAFGMARMYQLMTDNPNFEIFHSFEDAARWLGIAANSAKNPG